MRTRWRFDRFEVDLRRRVLTRAGRQVRIQPQPFTLLEVLISRAGETVTRAELQRALWPGDTHVAFELGLNTAVRKLRSALGESADEPRFVLTVPGVGYRFIAIVSPVTESVRTSTAAGVPIAPMPTPAPIAASTRQTAAARTASAVRAAVVAAILLASTITAPGQFGDPQRWRFHADRAREHVAATDLARAAGEFARAVMAGADEDAVFVDYSCVLAALKDHDGALRVIELGLDRHPRSIALRANRGLRLHAVGRYDEELAVLTDAVARDPASAVAQFHLGLGFARRSQYDASLAALERAVELSDDAAYYLSWLGRIAADAGDRQKAERVIRTLERKAASAPITPALIDAVAYHLAARSRS
ncbi:MAG TPA: winged helix-turn-helix domain-containing protein [Vicinamibacterales bacterium]|nr:winged helix-turn-helix domain-containing protein [Vicinamibacterales bacterium]